MLTRLKVSGFKNLVDTEIRFGPFTCIAGFNGVGKSNVFDAISFLSLLADHTFIEAARKTRGGSDVADLFTAGGDSVMSFDCDILIPKSGTDDFHQPAEASHTFLSYALKLRLVPDAEGLERIELLNETLGYITYGETRERLVFPVKRSWLDSVIKKSQRRINYIETIEVDGQTRIRISSDRMRDASKTRRGGGQPTDLLASALPRTALSAAQNADETRTAVLVRGEMRSWRILQLEPSALRCPDELQAPVELTVEGRHLPSTLHRIALEQAGGRALAEISNRLSELISDVKEVRVDRDEARRLLRLVLTDLAGRDFLASSLSDGTLRFIALSVLERDSRATGVICLEEPENGIHPRRIGAMMDLLRDMATDLQEPVDEANPLRQIIVSTHSPVVVAHVTPESLVFASHRDDPTAPPGQRKSLVVRPVADNWRSNGFRVDPISKGEVIRYLGSIVPLEDRLDASVYQQVVGQLNLFGNPS